MNELVLFGVTGDLARQKLIPALYNLYSNAKIDKKSSFIGFGRKNFSKVEFQVFIEEVLTTYFFNKISGTKKVANTTISEDDKKQIRNFSAQWSYIESELDNAAGYKKLASSLITDQTVVYVSLPPALQYQVCGLLISNSVVVRGSANGTGRRIALEKPYGFDTESAEKLDAFLTRRLREHQILRVDHYAGKQALVEIENVARQGVFENILNNRTIKKIEVQINESIDVTNRGSFYDAVGALSDVAQNHILHMLATILAIPENGKREVKNGEHPLARLRGEALLLLEISKKAKEAPILGQYDGFKKTQGVKENSNTETFFRVFAEIKKDKSVLSKRWSGISVELMGGKALKEAEASIILYPKTSKASPGPALTEPIKILVNGYGEQDAYQQIFIDAFRYNKNRFIEFNQIKLGWNFVEKIKKMSGASKVDTGVVRINKKLVIYKKGSCPQDISLKSSIIGKPWK